MVPPLQLSAPPLPLTAGEAALGHVASMSSPILGWQVVPYSPIEDLPVQMFNSASLLPPLPPPSRSLRVSLMDATCLSRGEMQMHHIPFFFKGTPGGSAAHPCAHQAAALFIEQPS